MPIQYRCPACDQLLSISTRKAGVEVPCPLCGEFSVVPLPDSGTDSPAGEKGAAETVRDEPDGEQDSLDRDLLRAAMQEEWEADHNPPSDPEESDWEAPETFPPPKPRNFHDDLKQTSVDESPSTSDQAPPLESVADEGGFQLRRASPNLGDLDLTSMVDVTFLLLIFFMVTASFSLQKTIELPPPNPDQKGAAQSLTLEDLQANTVFVKVDEANQIFVDDVPAGDVSRLEDVLTQARLTTLRTELAIDAHPEARHETVVQVIDAATAAGMQKVRIVSRTSPFE